MTEERKKILAAVTERAENFVKGFDLEFAAGYMKKREEAEAEELLIRAGELMDQTFVFADKWDMEPCRDGVAEDAKRGSGVDIYVKPPRLPS